MISQILILTVTAAAVHATFLCPPHEVLILPFCSDKCSDLGKPCNLPGVLLKCSCVPTHARNPKGVCVLKKFCCTEKNEEYAKSGSDGKCSDLGLDSKTIIINSKKEGCFCKPGTVRNSAGKCVLKSDCYPKCTGANEVYKENACEAKCNVNRNYQEKCLPRNGCFCRDGYVRQNGICIRPRHCQCEKDNESYVLSGGCEKDCDDVDCLECPGPEGCYCTEGFRRNSDGNCASPEECKVPCDSRHSDGDDDDDDDE